MADIRHKKLSRCSMIAFAALALFVGYHSAFGQMPTPSPCGVPAFPSPNVPTGQSILNPMTGQPQILFNPAFFASLGSNGPAMFRYMLAHECSHHTAGDIVAQRLNPMGMLMVNPEIELRADCNAAKYLRSVGDTAALQTAIAFWAQAGNTPTGPNYPTGTQRAQMLNQCAQTPSTCPTHMVSSAPLDLP